MANLNWTTTDDGHEATCGAWDEGFTYRITRNTGGAWVLAGSDDELHMADEIGTESKNVLFNDLAVAKRYAERMETFWIEAALDSTSSCE